MRALVMSLSCYGALEIVANYYYYYYYNLSLIICVMLSDVKLQYLT